MIYNPSANHFTQQMSLRVLQNLIATIHLWLMDNASYSFATGMYNLDDDTPRHYDFIDYPD